MNISKHFAVIVIVYIIYNYIYIYIIIYYRSIINVVLFLYILWIVVPGVQ